MSRELLRRTSLFCGRENTVIVGVYSGILRYGGVPVTVTFSVAVIFPVIVMSSVTVVFPLRRYSPLQRTHI